MKNCLPKREQVILDWHAIGLQALAPERLRHRKNRNIPYSERRIRRAAHRVEGPADLPVRPPLYCRPGRAGIRNQVVHVTRNPLEVGASLEKRNRITTLFANLIWMRHVLDAEAASRGRPRVFVSYEALLKDWRSTINKVKVGIALDLSIDPEKAASINSLLNPERRHHAASRSTLQEDQSVAQWLKDAYAVMIALEANENAPEAIEQLDRVPDRIQYCGAPCRRGDPRGDDDAGKIVSSPGSKARFSGEIIEKDHELREKDHELREKEYELREKEYELRAKDHELRKRDRVIAEHQAQVEEHTQIVDSHRAELAQTHDLRNPSRPRAAGPQRYSRTY